MLKFAIDVTWVRHKIVGGTESFLHNLIKGFVDSDTEFTMVIVASRDNHIYFEEYLSDSRIELLIASVNSMSVVKRILWQNFGLSRFLQKNNIRLCLEPVYCKPILASRQIKFLTVIHDLEALHYPENHSVITNLWLRIAWNCAVKTSNHIVAISEYVRQDIINTYKVNPLKVTTIFDPITIDVSEYYDFEEMKSKYDIAPKQYYYTVSKLNPHKNLSTLIKVFGEIKKRNIDDIPCKLLISGVNGGMADKLLSIAKEYGIEDNIILTGFVENSVRNCLYRNARAFLFPSVFEGFGMPPIEAICCGTTVITTRMACIPEITQELANYVSNPYCIDDWIDKMRDNTNQWEKFDVELYSPMKIANQYLMLLQKIDLDK